MSFYNNNQKKKIKNILYWTLSYVNKTFLMFLSVFYQIILVRGNSWLKYDSVIFNLQENPFFSFSGKLAKKII